MEWFIFFTLLSFHVGRYLLYVAKQLEREPLPLRTIMPEPLPDRVNDLNDLTAGQIETLIQVMRFRRGRPVPEEDTKVNWIREGF